MNSIFLVLFLISFSLMIVGIVKPKTSLFWYKKERTRKKSFLIYFSSMILFFMLFGITTDESDLKKSITQFNDPLNIGRDTLEALIGKKVPYDKWEKWGVPKTLEGTNNQYWVVYLDSSNISFVSEKLSDKIIFADFDENSALKHISYLEEKRKERDEKINELIYGNGMKAVNIKLMNLIENDLNDPSSMKNVSLNYIDKDSFIIVQKIFTAKNGFGGRIKSEVVVSIDTLGNITEINKWID